MRGTDSAVNVIHSLRHWAGEQPAAVALRFEEDVWTWAELLDRVRRLARALTDAGVVAGDRIAFLGRNHPACLELILAGAWVGAVTVTVNYRLAQPEIAYVLQDSGATLVITRPTNDTCARRAGQLHGVEVAIADPETGHPTPPGEVGEVHLRGDQVMAGYWRAPEATQAALLPGGWGEVPKAVIVPVAGRTPETADVLRFCRDHLAAYKCPSPSTSPPRCRATEQERS